ncbi:MAG: outer membrane beta-barrel protein [Alphaproteobacteria bacterium]
MVANSLRILIINIIGLGFTAAGIAAQSLVPDDVLLFRKRAISDTLPQGIRLGGLMVSPGIEVSSTYDDNIFRTTTGEKSDLITSVKPAIGIQSNWDRHALFFGAEGEFGFYKNYTSENFEDYGVMLSGQYDITDDTYVILALSQANRHIGRGSLLDPNASTPTEYEVTRQQFRFVRELGVLQVELDGQNEDVRLSDVTASGVPNSSLAERDNQKIGGQIKFEYMPGNSLFARYTYANTDYALSGGASRNAQGYDIKSGMEIDLNRGIKASLFGTYINRQYETESPDTSRIYPGATLSYDITKLTTLTGLLETDFNETTVSGVAGVLRTQRRLGLAQQFTELLRAEIYTGLNDYNYVGGTGSINRETDLKFAGVTTQYKATEHLGIKATYDWQERSSPIASDEYRDNRASLSLIYMY